MYIDDNSQESTTLTLGNKLYTQLSNLYYTWGDHTPSVIKDFFGTNWRNNPTPRSILNGYPLESYESLLNANKDEINSSYRYYKEYIHGRTWFDLEKVKDSRLALLEKNPIAYFCMEFGLVDWLQIYAGGLGILAGDMLKEASDMGVPFIGVGIFYHQGYFHQEFDEMDMQQENYIEQDIHDYPVELVKDVNGEDLEVELIIDHHVVFVRAWRLKVGRNSLILLDTNYERNNRWEDRMITAHLYGGSLDTRIRQEIVLGIGGMRVLTQMGVEPSIVSMNEGHSAFTFIELVRALIAKTGADFWQAKEKVREKLVFTNHTLVQAGNDSFDFLLFQKYIEPYMEGLKLTILEFFRLGKEDLYASGQFSMTIFALRIAGKANAVSKLHGQAARRLWPEYPLESITNGVHLPTWVSAEVHVLLDKYVGHDWHDERVDVDWKKIGDIPDEELWGVHQKLKRNVIDIINSELNLNFDPDVLTLAWSRRFTAYKQPDIITYDMDRLAAIVGNEEHPVQIIMSGKTHPHDVAGKKVLQKMIKEFRDPRFKGRVLFVPGYNWRLARHLVAGSDVWLNTPKRYEEACGTSGMKASANGVLQFTTLDGWTDEIDWKNKGWVLPEEHSSKVFHSIIRDLIIPAYYNRVEGIPKEWVSKMKTTMYTVLNGYGTDRMMKDYLNILYLPLLEKNKG